MRLSIDFLTKGQLVKMLRAFNSEGIFKDDSVWFPTYHCLNIIWNYSSDSPKLSEASVVWQCLISGFTFFRLLATSGVYLYNGSQP
ncbi:hypothetical protein LSH36_1445g00004 [Paralvinella palmiformis]|uniref:Uncharacterized protein n=1 Tax=Paralvinella palmiformis TaxID=53620 RepID=A0AAD9ISP8_9ANNE|nr:hypothetical protein LSH36_1445g00004 [Paralvinella palmiformis]